MSLDEEPQRGMPERLGETVQHGACWVGHDGASLDVCSTCVYGGRLGPLIGDAFDGAQPLDRALDASAREAWRAAALNHERLERAG